MDKKPKKKPNHNTDYQNASKGKKALSSHLTNKPTNKGKQMTRNNQKNK